MSVDKLQEKIRKLKNPSVVDLSVTQSQIPPHIMEEEGNFAKAYCRFCRELLEQLKGIVPAVRFSFSWFAVMDLLPAFEELSTFASEQGYYVIVDAPEALSPQIAELSAQKMLAIACDGILLSAYIGSDVIKPYVKKLKSSGKALFVVIRTANKTAVELQDLMTGSRLVYMAVADTVNHMGEVFPCRCGFSQIGALAGASSADSLKSLRAKYKNVFLLLDGYDYPNANAKNCSYAFDKLGHGAAACAGSSITAAWQIEGTDGADYVVQAVQAAERMKQNLTRYVTVL